MPKSSMAKRTPMECSSRKMPESMLGATTRQRSVSSRQRLRAGKPVSSSSCLTMPTKEVCWICWYERFTFSMKPGCLSSSGSAPSIAVRSTHSPSTTKAGSFSMMGMKRMGGTMPYSGLCQRSSASAPRRAPVSASKTGW